MFHSFKRALAGVTALAALGLGGAAIAGAATSPTTTAASHRAQPRFNGPAPGTAAHESAEKAVAGDAAARAQAAAVKSVGGGTAGPVTTDCTGRGFETTVTKPDGTKVEVHLDSSYNVLHGPSGPAGPHHWAVWSSTISKNPSVPTDSTNGAIASIWRS